jgi:hypothetical protein
MLIGAQLSQALVNNMVTATGPESLVQWRQFWIIPCLAAGLIMVAFAALFKDRTNSARG